MLSGLFSLIVTRQIISIYGSDFNGLNSTAAQFVSVLLIIEGGFALAANVALFEPLSKGSKQKISAILSAVSRRFKKIGIYFFFIGIVASVLFAFFIKSSLGFMICFSVFAMLIISTTFDLLFTTRFKIIFQSDQKEYILNVILIVFLTFSNSLLLLAITSKMHMLILRLIVMCCSVGSSSAIILLCRKQYPFIDLKEPPDYISIKGTNDVFAQKITGVLYYAMPMIFISSFVGTIMASVYAVYNIVFTLLKSFSNAFINAPRMSLGRLIAEENINSIHIHKIFDEYEFLMIFVIVCMLSVSTISIMPFVKLYTSGFRDAEYINWKIALLLTLTCYFECIHIPSGNLINMAGKFRVGRNIQLLAGVALLILLLIGGMIGGLIGIMFAVMLTAIILAALEIGYVRVVFLRSGWRSFVRVLLSNTVFGLILVLVELQLFFPINSFLRFFIFISLALIINATLMLCINYLINRNVLLAVIHRFLSVIGVFSLRHK